MPEDKKEDIREGENPEEGLLSSKKDEEINKEILAQIEEEFKISEAYKAKFRRKWIRQMKMMKNEKLSNEKIGDETMYTIFDTLYSALTTDKLLHKMEPTEMGDIEKAELIEAMMENDYTKMDMDSIEDYWSWWSLFSGHVCLDMYEYNETILSVAPEYINPFLDYPDPSALSMHGVGIKRTGSARFYGYDLVTTITDMEEIGIDVSEYDKALSVAKQDYDKMNTTTKGKIGKGGNEERIIKIWYTRYDNTWYRLMVSSDFKVMIKRKAIDGPPPIADRIIGVDPSEWYPRTPPDMLEDKHKARANTLNIAYDNVREQQKSIYLSKKGNFLSLSALQEAQGGDIIEVKDPDGIKPMAKASITNDVEWILQKLDAGAQDSTATPDIRQGAIMDQRRTLGELSLVASGAKDRYGARARILSRSMKLFWSIWYDQMVKYFDENVHHKMVKIAGVYGPEWRVIRKPDFKLQGDFDIRIVSKIVSDQKDAIARVNFMEFHKVASADASYNIREGIKEIGRRSGLNTQKINFFIQKTVDEKEAEQENKLLAQNKLTDGKEGVKFHIRQDHQAHIREHMKNPMNQANIAHINEHYKADIFLKNNPEMASFIKPAPTDGEIAQNNTNQKTIGQTITPNNYTPGALPTHSTL